MGPQEFDPFIGHPGTPIQEADFWSLLSSPCLLSSWVVLFQQTSADPEHPFCCWRAKYRLPAILLMSSDKWHQTISLALIPSATTTLLQAAAGPPGIGQGLLVLGQLPEGPRPPGSPEPQDDSRDSIQASARGSLGSSCMGGM